MRKKTIEDYLEILYRLQKGKKRVHTNDIASAFNINPASVTEILQKLSDEGYIDYEKYSGAILTKKGLILAKKTNERHETITEFFIILGIDKKTAEEDACEMEHILHKKTMDSIIKFVEIVKSCEFTPFWLDRLNKYVETGKIPVCPPEIKSFCKKISKSNKIEK